MNSGSGRPVRNDEDLGQGVLTEAHGDHARGKTGHWEARIGKQRAFLMRDVMLLTCKMIPKYRICEEKIPRTQNSNDFIIQRVMFTCLFEGATSNRAELDYQIRHDPPRRESLSFIYDSYMQYHGPIPWVLLIPSI